MDRQHQLHKEVEALRERINNLRSFGARVAGDAERSRDAKRQAADKWVSVGATVHDAVFGQGVVVKVNRKTYTIRFSPTFTTTRDKSYDGLREERPH